MVAPATGSVILVPFPFSDLSQAKLRPAVILADAERGDWVSCQITSNPYADVQAIEIADKDFADGSLQRVSFVRPGKLFTLNQQLIVSQVGRLKEDVYNRVINAVVEMLKGERK